MSGGRGQIQARQSGATLVVAMIMLMLITLTVTMAFKSGNTNQKAVGNMQFRSEALAAANKAIEQVVSSPFTNAPAAEEINVDLNQDNVTDYIVRITRPTCTRALEVLAAGAPGNGSSSELDLPVPPSNYTTVWDIEAVVTDSKTGTSATIHHGVQVQLNNTQYQAVCT